MPEIQYDSTSPSYRLGYAKALLRQTLEVLGSRTHGDAVADGLLERISNYLQKEDTQ